MPKTKTKTCRKCRGQLRLVTAANLRTNDGQPLQYAACPGDCAGITRRDIQAGKVSR